MKILVTGGAGFIGANLCRRLLAEGHRVACLDNLSTGRRQNVPDGAEFRGCNVVTAPAPHADAIYHLACPASPLQYQIDPSSTFVTATLGTANMLEAARFMGIPIVVASTSEVYGDPQVHPQPETYWGSVNPYGPRACYDEGKRAAETLCWIYRKKESVDVRIARIFNTYGPWMRSDDGRAIPIFIRQALQGEPLTVFGHGVQTRSCCYVDDLVDGLIRLMALPRNPEGPVNLGNPEEVSMLALAGLVRELTGSESPIAYRALPEDDPRRRCPDIARAEAILDWKATTPLGEGLARTIAWCRENWGLDKKGAHVA